MSVKSNAVICGLIAASWLTSCSMKEEIKRIEANKQAQMASEAGRTTNLTGEQIYIRSCNTCHPSGRKGPLGPTLIDMDQHYKTDEELKNYIRKGHGIMPGQPVSTLNDKEIDHLVQYLRKLNSDLRDEKQ